MSSSSSGSEQPLDFFDVAATYGRLAGDNLEAAEYAPYERVFDEINRSRLYGDYANEDKMVIMKYVFLYGKPVVHKMRDPERPPQKVRTSDWYWKDPDDNLVKGYTSMTAMLAKAKKLAGKENGPCNWPKVSRADFKFGGQTAFFRRRKA